MKSDDKAIIIPTRLSRLETRLNLQNAEIHYQGLPVTTSDLYVPNVNKPCFVPSSHSCDPSVEGLIDSAPGARFVPVGSPISGFHRAKAPSHASIDRSGGRFTTATSAYLKKHLCKLRPSWNIRQNMVSLQSEPFGPLHL